MNSFARRVAALVGQNVQVATAVDTITGTLVFSDDTFIRLNTSGIGGYGNPRAVSVLTSAVAYVRAV
ncbi:hypothetical protein KB559_17520 [Paenibacillus sp. Marseille-P2973]|uniref:hypothetical protein n=1 Tax=unclassified Paenibacillus TaxID=185978 RepID=UPI001B373311|nr:hypothetical protein [Paenibacillus sp. Marseille-P2973]MBQ4900637.1 hypothetical protein [Paenibacillus sp. Marseille-P2973]